MTSLKQIVILVILFKISYTFICIIGKYREFKGGSWEDLDQNPKKKYALPLVPMHIRKMYVH